MFVPFDLTPSMQYFVPPLVGAFIGYFTNKVAIRMLFRPLKKWRFLGMPVPMTPGVIPAKREQLARNMGEMIGDHLLTSEEVAKGLQKPRFQQHLLGMMEERVGAVVNTDLGPLPSLIPARFTTYFEIAVKTIKYQAKENIRAYLQSPALAQQAVDLVEQRLDSFLQRPLDSLVSESLRRHFYQRLHEQVQQELHQEEITAALNQLLQQKLEQLLAKQRTIADLLPVAALNWLRSSIELQAPSIAVQLGKLYQDPDIRRSVTTALMKAIDAFLDTLGPMAAMARDFLPPEKIQAIIEEQFQEKEAAILSWFAGNELSSRLATSLNQQVDSLFSTPLVNLLGDQKQQGEAICRQLSELFSTFIDAQAIAAMAATLITEAIEKKMTGGRQSCQEGLQQLLGGEGLARAKNWISTECVTLLRSRATSQALDQAVENMADALLAKRIGKLSNLLPSGVRDSFARYLQKMATTMLEKEVPGLTDSLQISRIVTEKINSLDLLRLEKLLLSIMEEQFKYINLFGALLGFLIGCGNVLLLLGH